jgi:hypothetical protein
MYVFQAELWCDDCGDLISQDPSLINTGDSDDYPQRAEPGETDSPNHCPSGADCPNRIDLAEYGCPTDTPRGLRYIGDLLETDLTSEGVAYVREMLAEPNPSPRNVALRAYWREAFDISEPGYVVIENTPGYLPEDDDPATFETIEEARVYASDLLSRLLDSIYESQMDDPEPVGFTVSGSFQEDLSVIVFDNARMHDLGRVIEILREES